MKFKPFSPWGIFWVALAFFFLPFLSYAGTISLSGTALLNDETSVAINHNMALRVNGGVAQTTTSNSTDGTFSFGSVTANAGDTLTLYFYGSSDTTVGTSTGNTVTITDGATNITGLQIMDDHLVIRSDNGNASTTIADLVDYDNDQNANNLLFDAEDLATDTLSAEGGAELYIPSSHKFKPTGNSNLGSGGIDINGTWEETGSETLSTQGSFEVVGGLFDAAQGTVDFYQTGTVQTITGVITFYNLIFSGSNSEAQNISDDLIVQNDLSVTRTYPNTRINADGSETHTISVAGDVTHSGINHLEPTLEVVLNGITAQSVTTSSSGKLGSLQISNTNATISLGSNLLLSGSTTINANTTLDVTENNYSITLEGSWVNNGTFTPRQGTVNFFISDNYQTVTGVTSFYNLTFSGYSNLSQSISDDLIVQNDLRITRTYSVNIIGIVANGSETHSLSVAGDVIHTGTYRSTFEADLRVILNGTTAQTVTTSGTGLLGDLQVSNTTVPVSLGANLQLADDLIIDTGATLDLAGYNVAGQAATALTVSGTLKLKGTETITATAGKTLNAGSTILYYGAGSATLSNLSTTFSNLTSTTSGKTLIFPAGQTTTVSGTLTLKGESGSNLILESSGAGTNGSKGVNKFTLSAATLADSEGHSYLKYLTVYDSTGSGGASPLTTYDSTDGGNNTGWSFLTTPQGSATNRRARSQTVSSSLPQATSSLLSSSSFVSSSSSVLVATSTPAVFTVPELLTQVAWLQGKLVSLQPSFTRPLSLGSQGPAVRALQTKLNVLGFLVAQTGPGSPSYETPYFGPGTKRALATFQLSEKLIPDLSHPAAGYLGPKTRALLNSK